MFVGHYSASLVAKRVAPRLPLWALLLAAQAVDVAWAVFILIGVENVRIVPGHTATNPLDLYHMPYTHSLPAAVLWSVAAALLTWVWARRSEPPARARRLAWVLGAVVFSHWWLDLIVHVPDLPLWDDRIKVGMGLWNYVVPATALELALLIGAAFWLRADRVTWRQAGGRALGIFVAVLVIFHAVNLFGPPPPSVAAVGIAGLAVYLLVAAGGGWLERRATRHDH
ncbi:MAG TPA: hypothetical protein VF308_00685 [Caldimonas sp.]